MGAALRLTLVSGKCRCERERGRPCWTNEAMAEDMELPSLYGTWSHPPEGQVLKCLRAYLNCKPDAGPYSDYLLSRNYKVDWWTLENNYTQSVRCLDCSNNGKSWNGSGKSWMPKKLGGGGIEFQDCGM